MATETFEITSYEAKTPRELNNTAQGIPVEFPACILCRGRRFLVIVYLLDDSSPVPYNTFLPQHKCGTIFIARWQYDRILDMLSSEKPVYCYLNSNTPQWNSLSLSRNQSENRNYKKNPQQDAPSIAQVKLLKHWQIVPGGRDD